MNKESRFSHWKTLLPISMYFFSEKNFLAFDAIYLYVSFHQSLMRSGYKMRVYVLRLFMISIYSFLSATIIICMLMVSIPTDLQKHIRNDLNLMIFQGIKD